MEHIDGDIDVSGPRDPDEAPTMVLPSIQALGGMRDGSVHDHMQRVAAEAAKTVADSYSKELSRVIAIKNGQISNQAKTIHELQQRVEMLGNSLARIGAMNDVIGELEGKDGDD